MAITNYERVDKAMEMLKGGLAPFVERELFTHFGKHWLTRITEHWHRDQSDLPAESFETQFSFAQVLTESA